MKEIEADGFITREADVSQTKRTCFNCRHYKYDFYEREYRCTDGHVIKGPDWRQRYEVCDRWEKKGEVRLSEMGRV
nr:hypothetical protein [Clostridia bacterium]